MSDYDEMKAATTPHQKATKNEVVAPKEPDAPAKTYKTGDPGIDSGGLGACTTGAANGGCFLPPLHRIELNSQIRSRMARASNKYNDALLELKVAQMIKKTDELPWYVTILLGACGSALEMAAGAAVRALKHAGAASHAVTEVVRADVAKLSLKEAVKEANEIAASVVEVAGKEAEVEVATLGARQVETLIKTSVDVAKDKAKDLLAPVTSEDSSETNEKNQSMSYIDVLGNQSAKLYQDLDRRVGAVTDAEALALWESFDWGRHTKEMYVARLGEAIHRYTESQVSKMGRSMAWDGSTQVEKEVRIARVLVPGAGIKYAYMDRVFSAWYRDVAMSHPGAIERNGAYDSPQNALSLEQEGDWKMEGKEVVRRETPLRPDRMLNYVEPEFLDLALQKQEKVWLNKPETYQLVFTTNGPQLVKVAGS